jgi:hypothetical protein
VRETNRKKPKNIEGIRIKKTGEKVKNRKRSKKES